MLCSFILDEGTKILYDSFISQEWGDDFELLYCIPEDKDKNHQEPNIIQQRFCKTIYTPEQNQWKHILNSVSGHYFAWIHPYEEWGSGFLTDLKIKLISDKNNSPLSTLVAGYGFMRTKDSQLQFVGSIKNSLLNRHTLSDNIFKPKYYNPLIKYYFCYDLVMTTSIPLDYNSISWQERYALFTAQYLVAIKNLSGGREVDLLSSTQYFSLPDSLCLDTREFREYQLYMKAQKSLLTKSVFEKAFWIFLMQDTIELFKKTFTSLSKLYSNLQNRSNAK